ncbi:helix-turn-helix domain-containing protein [Methylomagnum ishizawai]
MDTLDTQEAADLLRVSVPLIREMANRGEVPAFF